MESDLDREVARVEAEIGKRAEVIFPDGGGIIINDKLYELEKPVFRLIVDAIVSNQHLTKQVDELKSALRSRVRAEIMRGVS